MKLITDKLIKRFAEVGKQDIPDPLVIAKFFNPAGGGSWWVTEYNPEQNDCFGFVTGLQFDEWGYFSIDELEAVELPFGLRIERNIHFQEDVISKACPSGYLQK